MVLLNKFTPSQPMLNGTHSMMALIECVCVQALAYKCTGVSVQDNLN